MRGGGSLLLAGERLVMGIKAKGEGGGGGDKRDIHCRRRVMSDGRWVVRGT